MRRRLAITAVLLAAGCAEDSIVPLAEVEAPRLYLDGDLLQLSIGDLDLPCVELAEDTVATIGGVPAEALSLGGSASDDSYQCDLDPGFDCGFDHSDWCRSPRWRVPPSVMADGDDLVVEIADASATLSATYAEFYRPATLTPSASDVVDGRTVQTFTHAPSSREIGMRHVNSYRSDVGDPDYPFSAEGFDVAVVGTEVTVTFPVAGLDPALRYAVEVASQPAVVACVGFASCRTNPRSITADLVP